MLEYFKDKIKKLQESNIQINKSTNLELDEALEILENADAEQQQQQDREETNQPSSLNQEQLESYLKLAFENSLNKQQQQLDDVVDEPVIKLFNLASKFYLKNHNESDLTRYLDEIVSAQLLLKNASVKKPESSSRTVIIEEENNELIYEDGLNLSTLSDTTATRIVKKTDENDDRKVIEQAAEEAEQTKTKSSHTNILHINGLTRPFTLTQLKEMLKKYGQLDESKFWINNIKSHCFATFENADEAAAARNALNNTNWPASNPKALTIEFASEDEYLRNSNPNYVKTQAESLSNKENKLRTASLSSSNSAAVAVAALTAAASASAASAASSSDTKILSNNNNLNEKSLSLSAEKKRPIREWDIPKLKEASSTSAQRQSNGTSERRRVIEQADEEDRLKNKRHKRDETKEKEKVESAIEEAEVEVPAKQLDDLFRKTNTTPCIYWLPLSESQVEKLNEKSNKTKSESVTSKSDKAIKENLNESVSIENKIVAEEQLSTNSAVTVNEDE